MGCERVEIHRRFDQIVPSLTAALLRTVETGSAMLILRAVRDLKLRLYYAAFLQSTPNESVLSTIFSAKAWNLSLRLSVSDLSANLAAEVPENSLAVMLH